MKLLTLVLCLTGILAHAKQRPPFILTDDQAPHTLSVYGTKSAKPPTLTNSPLPEWCSIRLPHGIDERSRLFALAHHDLWPHSLASSRVARNTSRKRRARPPPKYSRTPCRGLQPGRIRNLPDLQERKQLPWPTPSFKSLGTRPPAGPEEMAANGMAVRFLIT